MADKEKEIATVQAFVDYNEDQLAYMQQNQPEVYKAITNVMKAVSDKYLGSQGCR
jgi:hypothetical protein